MNQKKSKKIMETSSGVGVAGIGIYMISHPRTSVEDLVVLLIIALVIFTFVNTIAVILKFQGENKKMKLIGALMNLGFSAVLFYFRFALAELIPYVFASYVLINSIVKFISAVTYWRDGVPNYGISFVNGFLSFGFGIYLFFNSYFKTVSFAMVAGIYLIWYGVTLIFDAFNEAETQAKMSQSVKKMQRRMRIALPSLLGAFVPMTLLKKYDDKIASEDANAYILSQEMIIPEKAGINPMNVEILVHLSKKLMEAFGHVDLIFGDEVISYGNFDKHSYRLGGIMSDGVLFICNKDRYLRESILNDKKVLISFKVAFSDEELEIIKKNYERFQENMEEWFCDTQLAERGLLEPGNYTGVEDTIYKGTGARFYKFLKGPLKTYFALDTNCVKVADSLFEKTGFEKPATGNIVTPGAYYQFLMGALERPGTKIYEKKIYSRETFENHEKLLLEKTID
ncbi:HdeD family acid-resistance protein [Acetobacterium woodii]|uniref:DUF308 domain-containing protein n=1 Tax=Acetobacterium woodii (strain ATCC 29683 / DSM 1030 / JCM 2381 / KCTC 1655 / WB1) TaxID=931626 RepID=H6LEU0_ACEWD|nr:DUF308 domain-containing protein [Acetobacterium woodii]AFA49383.1 hypothetical protein Awo_c26270 [Acetobacterium woodii DSM 1030]